MHCIALYCVVLYFSVRERPVCIPILKILRSDQLQERAEFSYLLTKSRIPESVLIVISNYFTPFLKRRYKIMRNRQFLNGPYLKVNTIIFFTTSLMNLWFLRIQYFFFQVLLLVVVILAW